MLHWHIGACKTKFTLCNRCAIATDVPLPQMCHCNWCSIATHVPLQHMCQCNTCANATHASVIFDAFWWFSGKNGVALAHWRMQTEFESHATLAPLQQKCQCNTCVIATDAPLQQMCHCNTCVINLWLISRFIHEIWCCIGTCVAMAHVLQWHMRCIGTLAHAISNHVACNIYIFVAMAHVLQWHICCNGTSVALAHMLQWHIGACRKKFKVMQQLAPPPVKWW